jgi:hypothetical protein
VASLDRTWVLPHIEKVVAAWREKKGPHATARRRNDGLSMTENEIAKQIMDAAFLLKNGFTRLVNGLEEL